jgi:hypothetical protein
MMRSSKNDGADEGRCINIEKRWLLNMLDVKCSHAKDVVDHLPQGPERGNTVSQ